MRAAWPVQGLGQGQQRRLGAKRGWRLVRGEDLRAAAANGPAWMWEALVLVQVLVLDPAQGGACGRTAPDL